MTRRTIAPRTRRTMAVLGLLAGLAACVPQGDERLIDERLMASLGQARALHHLADVHLAQGEPDEAIAALERIIAIDFPEGSPERDDVVVDTHGRIAKILIGVDKLDEAAAALVQGRAEGHRDTFYTASLELIEGEIHEARAKKAREAGDSTTARDFGRKAIEAYERSIAINQRVMERLARETDEEPAP